MPFEFSAFSLHEEYGIDCREIKVKVRYALGSQNPCGATDDNGVEVVFSGPKEILDGRFTIKCLEYLVRAGLRIQRLRDGLQDLLDRICFVCRQAFDYDWERRQGAAARYDWPTTVSAHQLLSIGRKLLVTAHMQL